METAKIKPAVNQIEAHPRFPNSALVAWCLSKKIAVVAWGPLASGRGRLAEDQVLWTTANMHQVSVPRMALRWNLERGVCVVPRSANPEHVRDCLEAAAGPKLPKADVELLTRSRPEGRRRFPDVIGVWPASANVACRLLGWWLDVLFSVLFRVCSVDVVALAKRRAIKREATYAALATPLLAGISTGDYLADPLQLGRRRTDADSALPSPLRDLQAIGRLSSALPELTALPSALPLPTLAVLGFFALYGQQELKTLGTLKSQTLYGNVHKKDLEGLGEEWPWGVAGDEDFDPLGLYGLLGNDAVGRFTMRELELNHGRVAMLAVLSYVMLESVTHVPVVQLTPFLFGKWYW